MISNIQLHRGLFLLLLCTFSVSSQSVELNCADAKIRKEVLQIMVENTKTWDEFIQKNFANVSFSLKYNHPKKNMYTSKIKEVQSKILTSIDICRAVFYDSVKDKQNSEFIKYESLSKICTRPYSWERFLYTKKSFDNYNYSQDSKLYEWIRINLFPHIGDLWNLEVSDESLESDISNEINNKLSASILDSINQKNYLSDIRTRFYDKKLGNIGCKANLNYFNEYLGKELIQIEYTVETTSDNEKYITVEKWAY